MSNELLDFTQRDNFDFLKFSSKVKDDDDKAILKRQCERVLEFAHATVQDMCLLGWHLKELKNSKTWQEVFEPKTGTCFSYFSFQDFCEYAFGFSKTRTSNLLSLSEFVKISGTHTNGFIEEQYAGYNTSQLIELSSVPSGQKHYFNPDMTVKDIRLVKKYIASDGFWCDKQRDDFDLLSYAKEYAEQGQKKQSKSECSSDILPGQIGIEIPTSELAGDGDEVQEEEYRPNGGVAFAYCDLSAEDEEEYEPNEGEVWQGGGLDLDEDEEDEADESTAAYAPDEYDEEDEAYEDMQADMQTIEEESERNIVFAEPDVLEEQSKYNFSSRDGVRAWLKDWENWELFTGFIGCFFSEIREFRLKNGTKVWATFQRSAEAIDKVTGAISLTYTVRYFFQTSIDKNAFEVTKEQIECYIAAHRNEL